MKSKFGDYATLDVLAKQQRVQGGNFDLRVLTDGSLSKAKVCCHLMIEKMIDRIEELGKPYLKLVVMHDFMWALKEQASDRAHQHQARNKDSGQDICVVESEAHDISQSIIAHTLQPGCPTVCDYVKGQSLMVDVLWEVAYGVFKEVLCLNSLEDFNTTEADLMDLKNDILTTWKSRDKHRTLSLGPTFIPSSARASKRKSTLGDTFSPSRAMAPVPIHLSIFSGSTYGLGGVSQSPLMRPLGPPPGILYPLISVLREGYLPHFKLPFLGIDHGIQL